MQVTTERMNLVTCKAQRPHPNSKARQREACHAYRRRKKFVSLVQVDVSILPHRVERDELFVLVQLHHEFLQAIHLHISILPEIQLPRESLNKMPLAVLSTDAVT